MEWLSCIRESIRYMEEHLLTIRDSSEAADAVFVSPFYLQKGFKLMTGYSMTEYIRSRRLYLAALDVLADKGSITDLAFKYGYDTPESFSKAFSRFHGCTPTKLKSNPDKIRTFLPLKITIKIQGGNNMNYTIEEKAPFRLIGFERSFPYETAYQEIPVFWDEIFKHKIAPLCIGKAPETELEQAVCRYGIGEFGVSIDDMPDTGRFRYLIAGVYTQGDVPDGMTIYEVPALYWAKFSCVGPLPGALQSVNTKIFSEWLPNNSEYELAAGVSLEWYSSEGKTTDADYESAVWIPVKKKDA